MSTNLYTVNDKYFNWVCRACLRELVETTIANEEEQRGQWQSIFDKVAECDGTQSIAELLTNTISEIEVNPGDNLSKKICHECTYQLKNMHRFQLMCIQSDREMRAMIAVIDATDMPTEKQLHLPKEQQQSIPDPLQNVGAAIETYRDTHEDVNNLVKNEPCDENDEFIAIDNLQEALLSTISVEQEEVKSHDSWVCELERSGHGELPELHTKNPSVSDLRLQQQQEEEVVIVAKTDSSTHVCVLCKSEFKESRLLKRHMKRHAIWSEVKKMEMPTPKTKKKIPFLSSTHVCVLCKKEFTESRLLKRHMKRHAIWSGEVKKTQVPLPKTKEKPPFLCPECGKSFSKSQCLKAHRIRHSEERPFECPICPARFHSKGDQRKHKLIHEAIKPYMCDICGNRFTRNHQLTRHKTSHGGEKPFKCDYCEMRFFWKEAKRTHMLTHTGEKRYKCKYCERAFAKSGDHVKHLRTHLGDNVYGCTLCPSAFRLASERRAHFVTHKNDDEETRERNMKALKDKEAKLELKLLKNDSKQPCVEDSKQQLDQKITM